MSAGTDKNPLSQPSEQPASKKVRRILDELTEADATVHPALIPGIGVEDTGRKFSTNWWVFAIAAAFVAGFVLWGSLDSAGLSAASSASLSWVSTNFGWLFSLLTIAVFAFMMVVGYSQTGHIRLGADDEKPEYSFVSWVAMLFSAGMGIGLLFFGPYEPFEYFMNVPFGFEVEPGSRDAMHSAMAQTMFHWGPMAWAYYALVGGAIAYSAYRRGRSPLISAIFDPIFSQRTKGVFGAIIDIFAIIVTLFGTAVSLGIGALQIGRGIEVVAGIGELANGIIVAIMAVLTVAFIISAVSGIKRGIRALSNANMALALCLGLFVFITGPTLFLLNFIPAAGVTFFEELGTMLQRSGAEGGDAAAFMETWTTYYWAWWVSWTPFVGMFVAKISRGRTLREFVTVVIIVPSFVCLIWFGIFGGTSMWLEQTSGAISAAEESQDILFLVLAELPFGAITSLIAMLSIVIFFVTSADSASIVMGSMSQRGKPAPSHWVTIVWGLSLTGIAVTLLLAGGSGSLNALQALVTVSALPFALVLILMMVAWWKDLRTDPYMIRHRFARVAISEGVRAGIEEHGDDFVFAAGAVEPEHGAGAWLDTEDPALSDWYEDARTGAIDTIDVAAEIKPGSISEKGAEDPGRTASGDAATTVDPPAGADTGDDRA
ncbi:BCCT family transporter [Mycetocola manganoxydans]|uniref:BCCT family transporter n=1 Tax=Mycetocola manganoxydans TaxID=699879 RepID=A0A3L6ZNH5_9MICO|nr:BCCT family transporter [Mycetocola manganoxydans]RLP69460.1 BCCT family transporter [Mycetocola manganoxydans]GHD50592.1 choline transporter [Mycetocola manganoxydans]